MQLDRCSLGNSPLVIAHRRNLSWDGHANAPFRLPAVRLKLLRGSTGWFCLCSPPVLLLQRRELTLLPNHWRALKTEESYRPMTGRLMSGFGRLPVIRRQHCYRNHCHVHIRLILPASRTSEDHAEGSVHLAYLRMKSLRSIHVASPDLQRLVTSSLCLVIIWHNALFRSTSRQTNPLSAFKWSFRTLVAVGFLCGCTRLRKLRTELLKAQPTLLLLIQQAAHCTTPPSLSQKHSYSDSSAPPL